MGGHCYILGGFLWFRQIPFIWYFSLISLMSSISSTKISDDKLLQKHYVDDEQLLTNVCCCYVQKHAMTVCNVAIAQSLTTPTCKSQLKLTQELHFYYQICSMQHTLFIILFSFALLRFFSQNFFPQIVSKSEHFKCIKMPKFSPTQLIHKCHSLWDNL